MSEPVVIGPGDTVLLPYSGGCSTEELNHLREQLSSGFPGVKFTVIDNSALSHALVYRAPESKSDGVPSRRIVPDQRDHLLAAALDLLEEMIGGYTDVGSVGGIDNVRRSRWVNSEVSQRRLRFVRELHDFLEANPVERCNWCPEPENPATEFHPGGTAVHREGVER